MQVLLSNNLYVTNAPPHLRMEICERLTMVNPKFLEAEKSGRWTGNIERTLQFFREEDGCLILPRGFVRELLELCSKHGIKPELIDRRKKLAEIEFTFSGNLRKDQEQALAAILINPFGILEAPTGSGKTVIGLAAIAERRQRTLIVTHTRELQTQWVSRIHSFLGIPEEQIGIIGGGKKRIGQKITVALVQSLYKLADRAAPYFGHLIVDECHRTPSRTFTEAVSAFDCKYMLGLSATPWRRDQIPVRWFLGSAVHKISRDDLKNNNSILKPSVEFRPTNFITDLNPSEQYSKMLTELVADPDRNQKIVGDVIKASGDGGTCLVLSDRKDHVRHLQNLIQRQGIPADVLIGDMQAKDRREVVDRLNAGLVKVLCATGQLIGEGFDSKELSTLFVTTPIKFSGRVLQYVGRILRPAPGKTAKIIDFCDWRVGVLRASAESRKRIYEQL
jgi:superfamily II DNA or RNA helicase